MNRNNLRRILYRLHQYKFVSKRIRKAIGSDARSAYSYARDVIEGRFPEGEAAIANRPGLACDYACNIIRGRWPEAEARIATGKDVWSDYTSFFRIDLK